MAVTNPLVKLKRGTYASLNNTPSIDGTMYLVEFNDTPEIDESTAKIDASRRHMFAVDVTADDGVTVNRHRLDAYRAFYANAAGYAEAADAWSQSINVQIANSDGTGAGNAVALQGNQNVVLKLPASIKANVTGNVTGNASTASALKVTAAIGSATKPVYINASGVPVACNDTITVDINGSATSAGKWDSQRSFKISDAGTGSDKHTAATGTVVDGTYATGQSFYELILPSTITATLNGRANSALNLVNSSGTKLSSGSDTSGAYYPVCFSNGVPVDLTGTLPNDISGNAGSASVADTLRNGAGTSSKPVYINSSGVPTVVTTVDVSLLGSQIIPMKNLPKGVQERLFVTSRASNGNAGTDLAAVDAFIASKASSTDPVEAGDVVEITDSESGLGSTLYYIYDNNGTLEGHIFSAGAASTAQNASTADALSHNVSWQIKDASNTNAGSATSANNLSSSGTIVINLPSTIKATLTGTADKAKALVVSAAVGGTGVPVYIDANGKPQVCTTLSLDTTGNAATADILSNARNINGTAFNGSQNITTANWGTARNITIVDTGTGTNKHSGTAVSVNGSKAYELPLPSTITATLNGNATTATTADKTQAGLIIGYLPVGAASTSQLVNFNGSSAVDVDLTPELLFPKYTTRVSLSSTVSAGTWVTATTPANMATGTYIVQIKTNNKTFNNELFSGVMSFYSGTTAGDDSDEILLHSAGANLSGHRIYMRITRTSTGSKTMAIRYCADVNLVSGDILDFTFRRII